ncbi:MAG: DUF1302 domain-containing protein [Salinisphaeraceae bacterium]|nr:DUF1302 domain-containing protein [Salinisphaeraceae bacterium]
MKKHTMVFLRQAAALAMFLGLTSVPGISLALEYQFGEVTLQWDSRVSMGASWRMESPDDDLIGISNGGQAFSTNGDDANLAYDKNDAITTGFKFTTDMQFTYKNMGVFLRGTYRYDHVNKNKQFFNEENYAGPPFFTQDAGDLNRKRARVRDEIGNNFDLLDAYFFGDFEIGESYVTYRVGRQVLNWGESLFIQNGINSITSVNANRLRTPGFTIAELYEPAGMSVVNFDIGPVSVEAFHQWEWRKTEIDATGSYFSTNDFIGIGGNAAEIGFGRCAENSAPGVCAVAPGGSSIPRGSDIEPEDGGQYGVALRFVVPALNEMDVGVYFANYHSRLPTASGNAVTVPGVASTGRYKVEYPEDIQLFGLSFNTVLGEWAFQGEYSLKKDQPLAIDDVELFIAGLRAGLPSQVGTFGPGEFIQGWKRFDVSQIDLSAIRIIGPIELIGSDQLVLLGEVGVTKVHSMPSEDELRLEGPGTYRPGDATVAAAQGVSVQEDGYADATSWGYRLAARFEYNNVFDLFTLEPTLFFAHDVSGTSPSPIINFVEDRKQLTASLNGRYLQAWEAGLSYTRYWGGEPFNLVSDRDFVSIFVSYSF